MAFAGQRGWFYEEFGQLLHSMNRKDGPMGEFRGLIRCFDDCPARYEYGTISRGNEVVEKPYLALLANVTPADLRRQAKRGSSMWNDGFWARFAFVTPPMDERKRDRFPRGEQIIPSSIIVPLQQWHQRLGVPGVEVGNGGGQVTYEELTAAPCTLGNGVFEAYYNYHDALLDIVERRANQDLDGNYARFADKALRVAMLLGSLS